MSGGYFQYEQYKIGYIADAIETLIENNDSAEVNAYGDPIGRGYSPEIIAHFQDALVALKLAAVYAQRIDWLVSCDDGPESFLRRLAQELEALK
jgi:hypothetical protein